LQSISMVPTVFERRSMLGLSNELYRQVPIRFEPSKPWLIDPQFLVQLERLNRQGKSLYLKSRTFKKVRAEAIEGLQSDFPFLSFISKDTLPSAFLTKESWDQNQSEIDFWLPTELHISQNLLGYASSRHVSLKRAQFKGVGASRLASSEDYYHSWGGFPARDCLRSLISDHFVTHRSYLGTLKTRATFIYDSQPLGFPMAIAIRENNGFRLSQIRKGVTSKTDSAILRNSIFKIHGTKTLNTAFVNLIDNLILMTEYGLFPRSHSPKNFILDGRQIDTESIDILSQSLPVTYLEVEYCPRRNQDSVKKFEHAKGPFKLYRTWVSQLSEDVFAYATAMSALSDDPLFSNFKKIAHLINDRLKIRDKERLSTISKFKLGQALTKKQLNELLASHGFKVWDEAMTKDGKDLRILFGTGKEHPRHFGLSLLKHFDWKYFPNELTDRSAATQRWIQFQTELKELR